MWETWVLEPLHAAEQSFFFIMCKMTFGLNFQTFSVHCTISLYIYVSCLVIFFLVNKGRTTSRKWPGSAHATCESIISGCSFKLNPWSVWNRLPNLVAKYRAEEYSKILLHYQQYFLPNLQQYNYLHYISGSLNSNLPFSVWNVYCMTCFISLSFIYFIYKKN